ncbi:MAG TPA: DnaB-like helicase N-terminal domain-containing protein, partial [Armatimonadota bacterium]|nr:DnaB-like helicase N-terminal domain-containing protein [Armatimonadota bacterium]
RAEYALWLIERSLGARGDITELQKALLSEVAALDNPRQHNATPMSQAPQAASTPQQDAPLEREILTAMVQNTDFAQRAVTMVSPAAFAHLAYRSVFSALCTLAHDGAVPDARHIVTEDETVSATIAALAVRDPLPIQDLSADTMLTRLREEYELSRDRNTQQQTAEQLNNIITHNMENTSEVPPTDPNDLEALQAWQERLRKRSKEAARRIYGQENE